MTDVLESVALKTNDRTFKMTASSSTDMNLTYP